MCNCQMLKIVFSAENISEIGARLKVVCFLLCLLSHPRGQNTPHTYHSIPHRTNPKKFSA
jgi:hypothetical protein